MSKIGCVNYAHFPKSGHIYPQDLGELVTLCCSSQWSERRDGIAQLHDQLLLESSRELS